MKHPVIPMDKPITFEDWAKGREARRKHGLEVAPATVRRTESSSDRRLRKAFNGKRAPENGEQNEVRPTPLTPDPSLGVPQDAPPLPAGSAFAV